MQLVTTQVCGIMTQLWSILSACGRTLSGSESILNTLHTADVLVEAHRHGVFEQPLSIVTS